MDTEQPFDSSSAEYFAGKTAQAPADSDKVSGGRYRGTLPALGEWKCPRCQASNTGPLELGCSSCPAGRPGVHVEPVQQPTPTARRVESQTAIALDSDSAFDKWAQQQPGAYDTASWELMKMAFTAGWNAAPRQALPRVEEAPVEVPTLPAEHRVRRTIIAALETFKDQVLPHSRDEIVSGEWLGPDEVQELIDQLTQEMQS